MDNREELLKAVEEHTSEKGSNEAMKHKIYIDVGKRL